MKSFSTLLVALFAVEAAAFSGSSFTGSSVSGAVSNQNTMSMEYIPSGMSKAQWEKVKAQEKNKNAGKNLGKTGITTFKSRSFADWQKAGGKNLFPVDPKSVKDPKDLPYMQRPGGMADDSDLKKASPFGGMFGGNKKKAAAAAPVEEKKPNWWTLN